MFDIGFSELLVIMIVALVVIGPEKLPKVARTLGHLFGRAQRYLEDVKSDISRELELDELNKLRAKIAQEASSVESQMTSTVYDAQHEIEALADNEMRPLNLTQTHESKNTAQLEMSFPEKSQELENIMHADIKDK